MDRHIKTSTATTKYRVLSVGSHQKEGGKMTPLSVPPELPIKPKWLGKEMKEEAKANPLNEVRCPNCKKLICKTPCLVLFDRYPYSDLTIQWLHMGLTLVEVVCTRCKDRFIVAFKNTNEGNRVI
jgi:hypothetical protein